MNNERKFTAAALTTLVIAHCAGLLDLVALPVWIGALVQRFGFTPRQAGTLATLFLIGAVLASVIVAPRFLRLRHRAVAGTGFALSAAAFALAATRQDFASLAGLHLFAGLMTGTALSMVHGTMGRSHDPHRVFASANLAQGVFGIVVLAVLPQVLIALGGSALFAVFAGAMLTAALACAWRFPSLPAVVARSARGARFAASVWYAVGGVAAMTLNQSMVFSFVEVIGKARGFDSAAVLAVLVALSLFNLAIAAPLAMLLQKRLRAERVVLIGPVLQGVLALLISNSGQFALWAAAATVFVAVQLFTHTFAFGLLARLEPSGRALAATPAMLMTGAALGPVLGGLLGQHFGFGALGAAAIIVAITAVVLFRRSAALPPALTNAPGVTS